MAFIDGTVVNVALPALQSALNATVTDVQWVIEAYSLLLSALLLVGGSLGDRYGRRHVFVIGVIIFGAASAWCGLASGIRSLIMARAVQGFGAALLVPGSLAIISSSFREEDRGRAIGTWSGFSAITAAIGPVLGGWLIEQVLLARGLLHQSSARHHRRRHLLLARPGKFQQRKRAPRLAGSNCHRPRPRRAGLGSD